MRYRFAPTGGHAWTPRLLSIQTGGVRSRKTVSWKRLTPPAASRFLQRLRRIRGGLSAKTRPLALGAPLGAGTHAPRALPGGPRGVFSQGGLRSDHHKTGSRRAWSAIEKTAKWRHAHTRRAARVRLTKTRVRDAPEKPRDADAAANPVPVQRGPWGARTAQGGAAWPGRGKASAAAGSHQAAGGRARIGSGRAGWKGRGNYAETIAGKEQRPSRLQKDLQLRAPWARPRTGRAASPGAGHVLRPWLLPAPREA